jgi:hypothetical protein
MSFRGGHLLYTGDFGRQRDGYLAGTVRYFELSIDRPVQAVSYTGLTPVYVPLAPECSARFWLETPELCHEGEPPESLELKALHQLAARHPEEYAELLEGEKVIRALGG